MNMRELCEALLRGDDLRIAGHVGKYYLDCGGNLRHEHAGSCARMSLHPTRYEGEWRVSEKPNPYPEGSYLWAREQYARDLPVEYAGTHPLRFAPTDPRREDRLRRWDTFRFSHYAVSDAVWRVFS